MRLLARRRRWQAACLKEEVIRVFVLSIGLTLANLILGDGSELNRLQILALEVDIGDHAFPVDGFVEQCVYRRRLKNEITQIEKNRPAAINLDTVQERRTMHHDNIRA